MISWHAWIALVCLRILCYKETLEFPHVFSVNFQSFFLVNYADASGKKRFAPSPATRGASPRAVSLLLALPASPAGHTSRCLPQCRAWHAFEQ